MLTTRQKKLIANSFGVHDKDTGSAQVQVALLTKRILELTDHLKKNPKDNHSRRGLLKMVGQRRRFLGYILKHDPKAWKSVTKKLDL